MIRFLHTVRRSFLAAAGLLALTTAASYPARAADCDRACLTDLITRYVDALAAREPARLPLADDVRFTENSRELHLGEGLWRTVTRTGEFRQDYLDVRRQIAAAHVMLYQEELPVLYSLVLRVAEGKISGIETLVQVITPDSRFQPVMLDRPLLSMNDAVPVDQRMPRAELIRTALTYTEGLRIGSFVEARVPFAETAYRIENGVYMAGVTHCPREECPDILAQDIMEHPDIEAGVATVDEEQGIVLLWMNFGDTGSYGPGNALVTFEAFKVRGGKIHVVQAFFGFLPAATQRGWPSAE